MISNILQLGSSLGQVGKGVAALELGVLDHACIEISVYNGHQYNESSSS